MATNPTQLPSFSNSPPNSIIALHQTLCLPHTIRQLSLTANIPPTKNIMLHSLKKKASKHTASGGGAEPSAEFKDYKLKLETVAANLRAADKRLDESKKHWIKNIMDQRAFSVGYADGIADTSSDTYAVAANFSAGATDRYNHWVRETDAAEHPYNKMHLQLKEYLAEIAEVEKMYKSLFVANSESSRYQRKIDGMEKSKKDNDAKKERNLAKLDSEKEIFAAVQAEVTDAQKNAYAKSGIAQIMAVVASWQMNAEHVRVMQMSLEKTSDFSAENYEALAEIDIATMESDCEELSSQASVTESLPSSLVATTVPEAAKQRAPLRVAVLA